MKTFFPVLTLFLFLTGCSVSNKCEDYNCFTPPPSFTFEIVDADTGENLFTTGTLHPEDIVLRNEENQTLDYNFITENGLNVISLGIGWEEGLNSYRLILGPELEIPISLNSERKTQNCCTFYEISQFSTSPFEYQQSPTTGFFIIQID